jgi:hypothetical protein
VPEGAPLLIGGIEVYLAEAHNESDSVADAVAESFRGMTVLVSLSPDETDRQTLWTLRHALAFGRTDHWTGTDWSDRLAERVAAGRPMLTTAVIYAGYGDVVVAETVQSAVDGLRRSVGTSLALVLVADNNAERLGALVDFDAGVSGVHGTHGDTARSVFLSLCAFIAPQTLNGIDLALLPFDRRRSTQLGLARAISLRHSAGRLVWHSEADEECVTKASCVVGSPRAWEWTWSEVARFRRTVRKSTLGAQVTFVADKAFAPCGPGSDAAFDRFSVVATTVAAHGVFHGVHLNPW